jgi:hypothetical protein
LVEPNQISSDEAFDGEISFGDLAALDISGVSLGENSNFRPCPERGFSFLFHHSW